MPTRGTPPADVTHWSNPVGANPQEHSSGWTPAGAPVGANLRVFHRWTPRSRRLLLYDYLVNELDVRLLFSPDYLASVVK